jgi:hypothetical protein
VVRLSADLHRVCEGLGAGGEEHELLERELVAGVATTVDDVERGDGERVRRLDTSELGKVLVERDAFLGSASLGNGDGDAEDGVGTELAFVWGAVELDEEIINLRLVGNLEVGLDQLGADDIVDVGDGLGDTLKRDGRGKITVKGTYMQCDAPLPTHLALSPSRSSTASWTPVDAPEGTAARKRPSRVY